MTVHDSEATIQSKHIVSVLHVDGHIFLHTFFAHNPVHLPVLNNGNCYSMNPIFYANMMSKNCE